MKQTEKKQIRLKRAKRVRASLRGRKLMPRLTVFRSNRHISAQIIDDSRGVTIASASDAELIRSKKKMGSRVERAKFTGERLAEKAIAKKINAVRFDRGQYRYHGIVEALASGARKGGLKL